MTGLMKKFLIMLFFLLMTTSMLYAINQHYIVVGSMSIMGLQNKVNVKITEGYIPIGGVATGQSFSSELYIQAMVTKEYFEYMNKNLH